MSKPWPTVSLAELLRLERRKVTVEPETLYQEIGIYCFGRGIFHKTPRTGFEVGDKDLFLMKEGDFILQVTFAWEGAVAIVSAAEDGMHGSTRYPTFRVDESRCSPQFLLNYFKTEEGQRQLVKICPGSAGRNRVLSIKRISEVLVPLPPLGEQRRVVARIEELAAQIHEARTLRLQAAEETGALPTTEISRILEDLLKGELHPINTLGSGGENPIQIGPFGAQLHKTEFVEEGVPVLNVGNVWPDGLKVDHVDHVTKENVELPVPPLPEQRRIVAELDALQAQVDALKRLQAETAAELDALLPAILDRAFKGEL